MRRSVSLPVLLQPAQHPLYPGPGEDKHRGLVICLSRHGDCAVGEEEEAVGPVEQVQGEDRAHGAGQGQQEGEVKTVKNVVMQI